MRLKNVLGALTGIILLLIIGWVITNQIRKDPFTKWANTKDKLCWEKAGDFKISKYGVRCTEMNGAIIFNETFRPTDDRSN